MRISDWSSDVCSSDLVMAPPAARAEQAAEEPEEALTYPLGVARGQVAGTYIIAEAQDGLVIIDQHAAHERLVLERLRAAGAEERSEERRGGKEGVSTCRSRCAP